MPNYKHDILIDKLLTAMENILEIESDEDPIDYKSLLICINCSMAYDECVKLAENPNQDSLCCLYCIHNLAIDLLTDTLNESGFDNPFSQDFPEPKDFRRKYEVGSRSRPKKRNRLLQILEQRRNKSLSKQ